MLTMGAKMTSLPRSKASRPRTPPYSRARLGSQVAASAAGAGSAVVWPWFGRTPAGPSVKVIVGMPNLVLAGT